MEYIKFDGVTVPEKDIIEALKLVKELRMKAIFKAIHPIALRIALKYATAVDDFFAKKHLTPQQEAQITREVEKLLKQAIQT